MQGGFYQKVFAREGIEVVIPESDDQAFIHDTYLNELVNGIVHAETRKRYIAIARRMKAGQGIAALILGGTEPPPPLRGAIGVGVSLLDTAHLHVVASVAALP